MAQLLNPVLLPKFKKQYSRLPSALQKKFNKQLAFLLMNPRHPSLKSRKMGEFNIYEARLDYHNRFTYQIFKKDIWLLTIGPHDEGLGKK